MTSECRFLVPCLIAIGASSIATAAPNGEPSVRGYYLSGELVLLSADDQPLPDGWALVAEPASSERALVIPIEGVSDAVTRDGQLELLTSQAIPTGDRALVLTTASGERFDVGDLEIAITSGGWQLLATSEALERKPILDITDAALSFTRINAEEFAVQGAVALNRDLLDGLGLETTSMAVVGALHMQGTAFRTEAEPVVANAAAPRSVVGPDVIVSTIGSSFDEYGAVGNIGAYAFTTVSCNVGDADAIWINEGSQPNRHPVIGMELYRYKVVSGAGRFEQIGMSWLKHGFCAADAPSCTSINPNGIASPTYVPDGSCDWLGLFATDTYSAGLNGSQSNLGPRSEIQPWTGAYPYPYVNNGCGSSTTICKRLQVDQDDLSPVFNTGATYWGESVYITTDEPQSYIRHNNYSYRQVTVGAFSGGQYNLSFTGSTVPLLPALQRWASSESGVTIVNADVPGDGRFVLGYKVTDLGGGQYHYEYALLNMNSDRCAQAFEVPLPVGVAISNIGFHDIDHHSGEPYSTADWTPTTTPGTSQKWETQSYGANPNANALRWSTTFNYRFDSNAVPTPGNITLTLFKPGTPTTILIPADVPSGQTCSVSVYCTTSTTTNGCNPHITGAGIPSATAASGFTIDVNGMEGGKSGVIFYGFGQTAIAWNVGSTSTKCVTNPVQRTGIQDSGGTVGGCDGSYSLDWNDYMQANLGALGHPLSAGQAFFAQAWFRDPPSSGGTNLTDGLAFTLCP
jgi:hypothetical protein